MHLPCAVGSHFSPIRAGDGSCNGVTCQVKPDLFVGNKAIYPVEARTSRFGLTSLHRRKIAATMRHSLPHDGV